MADKIGWFGLGMLFTGVLLGIASALDSSRVPAAPVPCHCQKCKAKCCEVGK